MPPKYVAKPDVNRYTINPEYSCKYIASMKVGHNKNTENIIFSVASSVYLRKDFSVDYKYKKKGIDTLQYKYNYIVIAVLSDTKVKIGKNGSDETPKIVDDSRLVCWKRNGRSKLYQNIYSFQLQIENNIRIIIDFNKLFSSSYVTTHH